jgi:hypothetical protein
MSSSHVHAQNALIFLADAPHTLVGISMQMIASLAVFPGMMAGKTNWTKALP